MSLILVLGVATLQLLAQQTKTNHSSGWHPPASDQIIQPDPSGNTTNAAATNADMSVFEKKTTFDEIKAKAEKGETDAQYELGICYWLGDKGITQNYQEAVKWLRKAAEKGYDAAQYNLGLMYEDGNGVEKDYVEAAKWFLKAAEQGAFPAQDSLGRCYYKGRGVPQDYIKAVKWFRKAAEQGFFPAQCDLGICYHNGYGVPQDYVEAYKWFNLSAAQGDEDAISGRDGTVPFMTPDQIAEAQQLSREFKPRKESGSANSTLPDNPIATGTGFFITDDGYLISNYHVVKDATKVRLLTGAGLIDAKVVQVDAANDLALLKAAGQFASPDSTNPFADLIPPTSKTSDGRFAPLPIAASRTVKLGGTVATVGFPDIGLQGFAPKLAP